VSIDPAPVLDLGAVEDAAERIAPFIRRTPLMQAKALRSPVTEADLWLKLECLQPTGSFKVRGATNRLLMTPQEQLRNGIVTASGGNHGLATARAAMLAGVKATVFVPENISESKLQKLADWNADVVVRGSVFDEANQRALVYAEEHRAAYFHPFADPLVIAGQGTVALEILSQQPEIDVVIVAIGGGGLMAGIATVIKALKPSVRLIGVEPVGSPTLRASIEAHRIVTLTEVTTRVATMACARTAETVFAVLEHALHGIVLVTDDEMLDAARWLWREMGLAADLSGAAAIAALQTGRVSVSPGEKVCALVCGAGQDALS
jgi:threonine dehydratase